MIFVAHSNGVILAVGNSALECILYIEEHEVGHEASSSCEYDIVCIESEIVNIS